MHLTLKALMRTINRINATTTITMKATSEPLPLIATTAVTDRSCVFSRAIQRRHSDVKMMRNRVATPCTVAAIQGIKMALKAFNFKSPNANNQNYDAITLFKVKVTSEPLPDVGTTAVTDRSCEIQRAFRIYFQICKAMRNGVAMLDTVAAKMASFWH
jgi:hypothetical protein